MTAVDGGQNDTEKPGADAVYLGSNSQTSWLYQCMISGCSATFERLTDFRVHFVDTHQPGSFFMLLSRNVILH